MLTGCLETDGSEGEPLSKGCVWLRSKRERGNGSDEEKGKGEEEKNAGVRRREKGKKERRVINASVLCTWETDERENESKIVQRERKLLAVSGPNAYQFLCSWQEIGSLTTVGRRRLLSQSYSVLDGFNLEQLVDDEPIHMVFKSLSVS